jgi:hypothetical protein
MDKKEVRVGDRFGKLVVIGKGGMRKGDSRVFCKCDCGQVGVSVSEKDLIDGLVTFCNKCYGVHLTDGNNSIYHHPLHRVWSDMIMRCENPKRPYYYLYGGRGIKVCKEWRYSYPTFYKWGIENGYKIEPMEHKKAVKRTRNKWSLDRIDVNGDYCPENCRWVDAKTQNEHQRADLIIEYNGEKATVKQFLKKYNATVPFFYYLLRQGMTEIKAVDYIAKLNNATV